MGIIYRFKESGWSGTPAAAGGDQLGSEPVFDSGTHTMNYDMAVDSDYSPYDTTPASDGITALADPADPGWDENFVGFRMLPSPWWDGQAVTTSGFELIPARSGSGYALRHNRTGVSQQDAFSWSSDNMGTPGNGAHHFFEFWTRVIPESTLTQSLNVKWFQARHGSGAQRMQWNTYWVDGAQHDTNPPAGTTLWMAIDNGNVHTQQAIGPYASDLFTTDGDWFKTSYEYKPNSSAGAGDGIARMWVDGTKVLDVSASAVGVKPAGGSKDWCTLAEVNEIAVDDFVQVISFVGVQTTSSPAYTMDVDSFRWWYVT